MRPPAPLAPPPSRLAPFPLPLPASPLSSLLTTDGGGSAGGTWFAIPVSLTKTEKRTRAEKEELIDEVRVRSASLDSAQRTRPDTGPDTGAEAWGGAWGGAWERVRSASRSKSTRTRTCSPWRTCAMRTSRRSAPSGRTAGTRSLCGRSRVTSRRSDRGGALRPRGARFFLGSNRVMAVALGRTVESEHLPALHQLSEVLFLRGVVSVRLAGWLNGVHCVCHGPDRSA